MKKLIVSLAVIAMTAGICQADSGYEACLNSEKALKAEEKSDCSGMKYLLNPSGCFATRKKVKEQRIKCAELAVTQPARQTAAEPKPPVVTPPSPLQDPVPVKPTTAPTIRNDVQPSPPATVPSKPAPRPSSTRAESQPALSCDQLKEENARLKIENERLKAEVEQLKNR